MGYEMYEGQRPRGTKDIVSVRKNGQISFNSKATQSLELKNFKYAYLLFDKVKDRVGIELSNQRGKGSRKITIIGGTANISGSAFFKHFGIIIEKARKREPNYEEENNMITFPL